MIRVVLILDETNATQNTLLGQINSALSSVAGNLLTTAERTLLQNSGLSQDTIEVQKIA